MWITLSEMSEFDVKIDIKNSELCQIQETFSLMENLSETNEVSRPDSNVSFSSWTFSPITEEMNESSNNHQGEVTKLEGSTSHQQLPILQQMPQPVYQPACANYQPGHQLQQTSYPNEHYHHHPNAVYHHSVNIHNYNVGPQAWQCEPSMTYSVYNFNIPHVPQLEYSTDHHDPLASFNTPEVDYARCSTPEYIMALNSLNQIDSPPPAQTTVKTLPDCSYAPSVQDQPAPAPKHIELTKQDSGYNSDLDASPVIHYQDNQVKMAKANEALKKSTSTSTPAAYPILRIANMLNRENRHMVPRRLMSPGVLSMPGFVPKAYATSQSNLVKSATVSQTTSQTSTRQIQSGEISSSMYQRQSSVRFTSMADFQAAKKRAALEKRKVEEVIDEKENTTQQELKTLLDETDSKPTKRRRHNEPLNYLALQVMNTWYEDNLDNPYPSKEQKQQLAEQGGITVNQVKSWFANKRNRSNNTRPKKQRKVMEDQLLNICHQLAQDARKPNKDNAYYIQQLSSILDSAKHNVSP